MRSAVPPAAPPQIYLFARINGSPSFFFFNFILTSSDFDVLAGAVLIAALPIVVLFVDGA